MKEKRYVWLKLEREFFRQKEIKKLRRQAGGDTYAVIVLEMALLSLPQNGVISFDGLENDIAEEIALEIDEDSDHVRVVLNYLLKIGWAEISDENSVFLPCAMLRTGTESASAERMRRLRNKSKASQCDADVTPVLRNPSQCDKNVTTEKEIEKEREYRVENAPSGAASRPSVDYQSIVDDYNKTCTSLPKCTKLSDARRKAIAARLRTYTREEIHRAFALAQESEFMTGRNDRNWTASFDWIMKDTNMAKILDGNYNNRKGRENDAGNQFAERFSQYTI